VSEDIPGGQGDGGPTEKDILHVAQYNYCFKFSLASSSELTFAPLQNKLRIYIIYTFVYIYWGVEILKCSTCPRASYLKKVTCPDKILLDKLSCFLYKHLILANTVVKLNLFILSITSLHTILSMVLIKLAQTSLPK
jgi:hypothetical protein